MATQLDARLSPIELVGIYHRVQDILGLKVHGIYYYATHAFDCFVHVDRPMSGDPYNTPDYYRSKLGNHRVGFTCGAGTAVYRRVVDGEGNFCGSS